MNIRQLGIVSLIAAGMSGCASIPAPEASLDLLEDALDLTPSRLEARAEAGEARAQYSLSIVYRYGLNGAGRDIGRADDLKRHALASRGLIPITQYIPGLNGKPGRTAIINVPRFEVGLYEANLNDQCASALDRNVDSPTAFQACGGEASFRALKIRWLRARGE